ncbi:hypothetical protein R50073_45660 [Maricurvus nonylphenolicus]
MSGINITSLSNIAAAEGWLQLDAQTACAVYKGVMFKPTMKYFIYFALLLITLAGGYWYGAKIGSEQLYLNSQAARAVSISSDLRMKDEFPDHIANDLEAELNSIIIVFGRYLEEGHKWHPLFNDTMDGTHGLMKMAVSFRVSNPRVIDGIEYSPFKDNSDAYFTSEEYLSGLVNMPIEEREIFTQEMINSHLQDVARYQAAIRFYKAYERTK